MLALLFWLLVRDNPQEHPWTNAAEQELIGVGAVANLADRPVAIRYDARAVQTDTIADWHSVEVERGDPFELQLQLFLEGVAAGRPASGLPTWDDAVTNQRLIQAAYLSVAERREVAPEEISLAADNDHAVARR